MRWQTLLTQPTPRGGCHPLWVLGHVTLVEGSIRQILFDEPNPVASWADVFGAGTEAVENAGQYPPFEVVRARFTALRSETMSLLESLSDEDLSKPTMSPPKGFEREYSTYGQTFMGVAVHALAHRGQVADAIRAAGRRGIFD